MALKVTSGPQKAIVATAAALAVLVQVVADGSLSGDEAFTVGVVIANALGVYAVRNSIRGVTTE